jgi:hypothetical protein
VRHAGGSPSSRAHGVRVTKGCSTRFKKGSPLSPFAGTAYEWEGRSFSRVSSAHARTSPSYQPSSAQPTVEFEVPPRTRYREERWSSALHSRTVSCTALRKVSMVLGGSLPAPRRKTRGQSHAGRAEQARSGSEGFRNGTGGNTLTPEAQGEDRTLGVALARRSSRSRSRQLVVLAQRSGRLHFTRSWRRSGTGV